MITNKDIILSYFGVICPPMAMLFSKGFDKRFVICIPLTFLTLGIGGQIYFFSQLDLNINIVLMSIFVPPLSVFMKTKKISKFFIALLLTLLLWIPGQIYAHYTSLKSLHEEKVALLDKEYEDYLKTLQKVPASR